MKAVTMTAVGDADVLRVCEVDTPGEPGLHQVRVRIHAVGVNPVDTKLRSRGVFFDDALPAILGCDGAGVVEATGDAVTRFSVGDEVWFCNGGLGREPGNYARYTLVDEHVARVKPKSVDFFHAAAAPLVLITAWEALHDRAAIQAGQTVLIHAGAGGVGHVAIQLAKLAGAHVISTVSDGSKAAFVRDLGADDAILYRDHDFVEVVNELTEGRGADIVFDTVGGEAFRQSINATAHYGTLVTLLDPGNDMQWKEARNRNLRIAFTLMLTPMLRDLPQARAHHGEILDACAAMIDNGQLKIHVNDVLPLSQAAEAHRRIEAGGMIGKLVLDSGSED